jgi:hypothetical protein
MTLKVSDILLDYSYSRPSLAGAARSGAKGIIRYSAGLASTPGHPSYNLNRGKLITPGEFRDILAAGLDVVANDEWYENRVTEGYAAGLADAKAAAALWKSCGLAKGSTIYVSWDQFPAQANWLKVGRYVRGYRAGLAGYYEVDAYGGTGFLKWAIGKGLVKYGWRPNAGDWSRDGLPYQPDTSTASKRAALVALALKKTPAHLWQTGNYWFSKSADENLVLRLPIGSHLETVAANRPTPTPDPLPPIPPINGKEFNLDADAKARFDRVDAEVADLKKTVLAIVSDSKGKPHLLRTWLTKLSGKKVDLAP